MADKRDILINLLGKETVSPAAAKAAAGVEKLGDRMDATADDAAKLDREIEQAEKSLRDLAVAYARTGDAAERLDLAKQMRKQQTELRKLTKTRGFLPDFGEAGTEAASQFGMSFVARLGPLLARAPMAGMNPAALAIGAPLAAGAAVVVGTAVAGAVVGGVGLGGVVGGLKLAARDARVKAASKSLGDDVGAMMGRASVSFVPETLNAIEIVRKGALDMEPDFRRAFGAASDYVEPLTRGLMDAAHNAMPGIVKAMESAGPVIDAVADGMRDIGSAVGDSLSDLSEYADEGARSLRLLFTVVDYGIRATSDLLEGTAMLYGLSEKMAAVWSGNIPLLAGMVVEEKNADAAARGLAGGLTGVMDTAVLAAGGTFALSERQKILNGDMREGIAAAGGLSAAFNVLNGAALSSREAESQYQAAIDAVTASIKANGTTLDLNTAKGRANDQAIRNLIGTVDAKAQAVYDETLATKGQAAAETAAKGVYEQGRTQLIKNLTAILGNKDAAIALADKIMKIPKQWGTKVTTPGMGAAIEAAKRLKARIDEIDRRIDIKATLTTSYGGGAHTGQGYSTGMSEGGPVIGRGPKGVDSEPRLLAPGEHVLTAAEVDAAGGHSGVERIRSALRSGGSTGRADAPVMAGAVSRRSGPVTMAAPILQINAGNASGLERVFLAWLVGAIRDGGGNPNVLGLGGGW
ncbi:hypothetical protein [Micromonospora sp. L32]|uniref:hypothetical protein n=1 Tax=Micromonospora sp. L32 TaxID=3452214 RepID=UPI003F8C7E06